MAYYVANPCGDSLESPSPEQLRQFLEELNPADAEHGAAWVSDDSGNTLEFNVDGRLVFDSKTLGVRHMCGVSRERALALWSLLVGGIVNGLEQEPWLPGSTPATPHAWAFQVEEVSAGVYRCTGIGPRGVRVESTDSDPEKVLADCRTFARRYPA